MHSPTRFRTAATAAVAILALTSCGSGGKTGAAKPTITAAQAKQQVMAYDLDILSTLLGEQQAMVSEPSSSECETSSQPGPKGRVRLHSSDHGLGVVAVERNPEMFETFRKHLVEKGFEPFNKNADWEYYKNKSNGFTAELKESLDSSKKLTLTVSSPCVWPDGTPGPDANK
ncbi:hypothetical protein OG689_31125 [Kitasatospora sp. NBC_00240]|uniref:hypothetical protein n=1 Tax=Kitasatospora sp. NBC_00240 TaxID=2903567 RepID=UPI002253C5E9|nr:hypothetical protein [Kitasatospora sp. NBC_00240]MCX5213671.1 hypothetical protein [Kitasatospora sp. NBC_00240]